MIDFFLGLVLMDVPGLLVQVFFIITIVLMLVDTQKPPILTSIMTGTALIVFGLGGSIPAPLIAGLSVLNGVLWYVLAFQRYKQK